MGAMWRQLVDGIRYLSYFRKDPEGERNRVWRLRERKHSSFIKNWGHLPHDSPLGCNRPGDEVYMENESENTTIWSLHFMQHKLNTSITAWPSVCPFKDALLESGACASLTCLNAKLPSSHSAFLTLRKWYVLLLLFTASLELWKRLRPVNFFCLTVYAQFTGNMRDVKLGLLTIHDYSYSAGARDRQDQALFVSAPVFLMFLHNTHNRGSPT